ncbi:hypothetical protein [Streptomyces nigrescens]
MSGGPVDPADVPVFTGDLDVLETKIKALSRGGSTVERAGSDVHKSFGGLAAFYKAPEAEQLFGVTKPVEDTAHDLGEDMRVIAKALGTYAREITPLIAKFKQLKKEAADFQSNEAAEDDWSEDGDLTDENLARRNKIAEVWTAFQEAERNCHAKIVDLVNGNALHVIDATHKKGYGYRAEDLKQAKSLPWGDAVEESIPGWQVWEHAWEFGKGFVVDGAGAGVEALKTLFGGHGGDAAGEAWLGLAKLSTGITITTLPFVGHAYWMLPDSMLPSWLRESRTAMTETGKAFVAWDQWGSNNSRAAGAVTFNILSAVITRGGGSAVAGAGKAATAAKAISIGSKVAQAIDPMTYVAKGAGVGLSKLRGVMAGLKDAGHLATPTIPDGAYSLPEGSQKLPDGTIQLPKGAAVPEGATRLPGGRIKLPEDTVTLPPGTVKSPLDGPGKYMGTDGSLYREDGSLLQKGDEAKKESVPNPKAGADNPRTEAPAHQKQPALAGVGGRGDDATRVSSDVSDPARASDTAPAGQPDTALGGHAPDNMPRNSVDTHTPGGGGPRQETPSTAGRPDGSGHTSSTSHTDGPSTGGGHHEPASTAGAHPESPGTGGVDNVGHGSGDATPPGGHADDATGSGTHDGEQELTPERRKELQEKHVWLANNNEAWRQEHYDKLNRRKSVEKLVDGVMLPQLTKDANGKLISVHDLPDGPREVRINPTPMDVHSVPDGNLDALNKAMGDRRVSVNLNNAEVNLKQADTPGNREAVRQAQEAFDKRLPGVDNNSKISEELGHQAAVLHAIPLGFHEADPIALPKTPNGANMFDGAYRLPDGWRLIVEEKAPSNGPDWRQGKSDPDPLDLTDHGGAQGMRVQQGTRPYIRTILAEMTSRGGEDAKIAAELREALKAGKLKYILVKAKEDVGGNGLYAGVVTEEFKY